MSSQLAELPNTTGDGKTCYRCNHIKGEQQHPCYGHGNNIFKTHLYE